jgi:hypothetical protein
MGVFLRAVGRPEALPCASSTAKTSREPAASQSWMLGRLAPGRTSVTATVPDAVPSLDQSSRPESAATSKNSSREPEGERLGERGGREVADLDRPARRAVALEEPAPAGDPG